MYVCDNFGFVDDAVAVVPVGACLIVVLKLKSEAARPRPYMRLYGGVHHFLDWHVL